MGMPRHLILVRHGQSEGNVATSAAKHGDHQYYTDEYTNTPGHQWRLTPQGRMQAETIGKWVQEEAGEFDRYYVSPFVRTRETAGHMNLPNAQWHLNRALRERDWGDIGSMRKDTFEERYPDNFWMQQNDPLYWAPPGGESIAVVAEDRVRNVLSTLHRETTGEKVVCVTHGEAMWAFRIVLERLSDEDFAAMDADKSEQIKNCEAIHYSRVNPHNNRMESRLTWVRRARPVEVDGEWVVQVTPWRQIEFKTYTNDDLLAQVDCVPYLIKEASDVTQVVEAVEPTSDQVDAVAAAWQELLIDPDARLEDLLVWADTQYGISVHEIALLAARAVNGRISVAPVQVEAILAAWVDAAPMECRSAAIALQSIKSTGLERDPRDLARIAARAALNAH